MTGFIQLHRQLLNWGWYSDIPVRLTFLHLLIIANWEPKEWKGIMIKRGQVIVGRKKLSKEIGISEQQLRTSLLKLKSTQEITIKSTNKFSVVTIVKYNDYQDMKKKSTNKKPDKQPTINQQSTNNQPQLNKEINKEVNNILLKKETKELFQYWLDYRKEIKKPIKSGKTQIGLAKKIVKVGYETSKLVIENSVNNGWQGLFWDKKDTIPVKKQLSIKGSMEQGKHVNF